MKIKIKWTEQAVSNLESLIKDIERINPRLKEKNVKTIFNKINLLQNFPGIGRFPLNYNAALIKVERLVDKAIIPETDLELRELIAGDFLILYGLNTINNIAIILFIKHQAQEDYFF